MNGDEPHALAGDRDPPFLVDGLERFLLGIARTTKPVTKGTAAYGTLRKAVVTHDLPSSYPLDENWLRSKFDVGRTPLREALKRLAHEHFLTWSPHQAPIVRDIGVGDLSRLYETRTIIEPQIARLAAQRATEADCQRLMQILEYMKAANAASDFYQSVELDFALHAAIAQATRNAFLREASDSLNRQSLRLWYRAQQGLGVQMVDRLHRQLVDAIANGDREGAEVVAHEHVNSFLQRQQEMQRQSSER